jgi:hypothetical protein
LYLDSIYRLQTSDRTTRKAIACRREETIAFDLAISEIAFCLPKVFLCQEIALIALTEKKEKMVGKDDGLR